MPISLRDRVGISFMYFQELQRRLIEMAAQRIRTGQATERSLARQSGVSQPHMHNVLKGVRGLSMDSAGRLMEVLEVRISDLVWQGVSPDGDSKIRAVPMVRSRIGPGSDAALSVCRGHMPMPARLVEKLINPIAACLAPDLVMPAAFKANDLVLLDCNPAARANPQSTSAWVVTSGTGLRVRYVRLAGTRLIIGSEANLLDERDGQLIGLLGRNILEIICARIVWMAREMENQADDLKRLDPEKAQLYPAEGGP